ncbi:FecR family protein [Pedobacter lusitanus]|uniref:FecR family protein n=1 Tax=Pedobacter lusitanus TaxID=1503925 RepID=UPI0006985866|nr:FecR domain-containing protein [Pedobacter lusitanus]
MKDNLTFQNIILNHFNAPEDEVLARQVADLRKLSEENERIFQETRTIWESAVLTKRLYEIDPVSSARNFNARLTDKGHQKTRSFGWLKIAAVIAVTASAGIFFYPKKTPEVPFLVRETKQQIDSVFLSDGTKVILAENSRIKYPKVLADTAREVILVKGQAFFKVHHEVKRAFNVRVGQSKVTVLGTSFNINYHHASIKLAVSTGKVMFTPNAISSSAILIAGQAINYSESQHRMEWENGSNSTSWITKELVFVDMPLEEVCKQVSAYYNVNLVVHDQMRSAKKFNANFKDSSLKEILTVLKQTYKIRIDSNEHQITINNL